MEREERTTDAALRLATDPATRPHFVFVESRPAVAEALCHSFEQRNIGRATAAGSAQELIDSGAIEETDVVVLDVGKADHEAFGPAESLLRAAPHLRLIAASSSGKAADVPMLKRAGFRGFVKREASLSEFAAVAVAVAEGQLAFPTGKTPVRVGTRTQEEEAMLLARQLTAREHQILVMLVAGASSTEIGEQLEIRGTTVRTHIQNIMVKLQVHTRLQAVMFAVRHGLISVGEDDSNDGIDEEGKAG